MLSNKSGSPEPSGGGKGESDKISCDLTCELAVHALATNCGLCERLRAYGNLCTLHRELIDREFESA